MDTSQRLDRNFIPWVAVMRTVAIFMVLAAHISDNVSHAERSTDLYRSWVPYYGSFLRPCVPFFVMLTGFLLLPIRENTGAFLRKRLPRVVVPFVIWVFIYNAIPYVITTLLDKPVSSVQFFFPWYDPAIISVASFSDVLINSLKSLLFFNVFTTHMWYIFVIVGLYLYLPIFSAWVEKASMRAKCYFLALWFVSLFFPYLRVYVNSYSLGACGWNEFHMLYYFAGFNGYLLLGHVMGRMKDMNWTYALLLSLPMMAIGYYVTVVGFASSLNIPLATEAQVELFYTYCSPNVVLLTAGMFILIKACSASLCCPCFVRPLQSISRFSFGIYLSHYIILGPIYYAALAWDMPSAVKMTIASIIALAINWLLVFLLSKLPASRYLIG